LPPPSPAASCEEVAASAGGGGEASGGGGEASGGGGEASAAAGGGGDGGGGALSAGTVAAVAIVAAGGGGGGVPAGTGTATRSCWPAETPAGTLIWSWPPKGELMTCVGEGADMRAGRRYCAAYSEHGVSATEKKAVSTAEYV